MAVVNEDAAVAGQRAYTVVTDGGTRTVVTGGSRVIVDGKTVIVDGKVVGTVSETRSKKTRPGGSGTVSGPTTPVSPPAWAPAPVMPEPVTVVEEAIPLLFQGREALASGPSISNPLETGTYLLSSLDAATSDAGEYLQNAVATVLEVFTVEPPSQSAAGDEGWIGNVLTSPFYAAADVLSKPPVEGVETPQVPPGTSTQSPSGVDSTPQPSPPILPIGSSFSASAGGGQTAPGGGFALLLFAVLASSAVLLRRDGRLSRYLCELPKPSSVLLLPLERPG